MRAVLGDLAETGRPLAIDVQRLLVSRMLVQANSGGGKSWAIRRLLEQTHGLVPQLVLDVDDEFHTLREKYPYVLAGAAGGDCRVDVKTAPLLVRRILEHGFSTIVSIYEMKAHERLRFVRALLEALIAAPRALWRPLLVIVDEAHLFCPEKGQAESAPAVIDLMTRGRKRGFCGVLATQRISKLHKDAAAEANNKLIGRSALDVDMKRSADELGFSGREEQHRLRNLAPGTFYAFGPALSPTVVPIRIGPVETTHPEPGSRGTLAPPPAPEKLKAILAKLQDLPKDAEQEADELARLRAENADLRRKATQAARTTWPDPAALEAARRGGKVDGYKAAIDGLLPFLDRLKTVRAAVLEQLDGAIGDLERWKRSQERAAAGTLSVPDREKRTATDRAPATQPPAALEAHGSRPADRAAQGSAAGVTGPQQRILDALAWLESVRIDRADKVQLAVLIGGSPKSSGYHNNLGALRTAGLIDYPGPGLVRLTDEGRRAAVGPQRPPTTQDLHGTLRANLPAPQWRILEELIRRYPNPVGRDDLAIALEQSPNSSGYHNNLGALRSLGFIDYPVRGQVAALPVLFLEDR